MIGNRTLMHGRFFQNNDPFKTGNLPRVRVSSYNVELTGGNCLEKR